MSGKGSKRRRENTALVEANWDAIFGTEDAKAKAEHSEPQATEHQPGELAGREDHR